MSNFEPTKEQRNIIEFDGSLVAIAKPGSGKTTVLSRLIQRRLPDLSDHRGVIAISYTNKASDELKQRSVVQGVDIKSSFFGTIDKFCGSEIIIPFLCHIWGMPEDRISIVKIKDLPVDQQENFSDITKNTITKDQLENHIDDIRSLYRQGKLIMETNGSLACYTIDNSYACRRYLKKRYANIIIDEYQDSGIDQHDLFLKLKSMGLTAIAVGDPDQSIFGFSHKDPKHLLDLARRRDFRTFPITKNHRCHPSIVNYSLRLLDKKAELIETDEIRMFYKHCAGDSAGISSWIDKALIKLVDQYDVEKRSGIGILVRGGATGERVSSTLESKHRYFDTHPLETHLSLWSRVFVALMSYRCNKGETALDIIESSGSRISGGDHQRAKAKIKKTRTLEDDLLFDQMIDIANTLLPQASSEEAVRLLRESNPSEISQFFKNAEDDEIQIMSIHKAKGLEFDIVFHLDLHEWVLPCKTPGPNNDWDNLEYPSWDQDMNLHYVGITRARKACILCTSDQRINSKGQTKRAVPSEFLGFNEMLREEI